ncbi:MAG: response regulator transcription factor, partial [Solirubrobacterales bacterium]|nr:response regulator transcription factor [Solirubrobacterales bacterium]
WRDERPLIAPIGQIGYSICRTAHSTLTGNPMDPTSQLAGHRLLTAAQLLFAPMQIDQRSTVLRHPVLLMVPVRQTTSRVLQALRSTGFETRILDAVPDVLDAARAHNLAALVLEVGLVGSDPRCFLDELRRVAPQLPVIALTSREQREQTVSLLRGTLDDYLTTPFPVEELVSRLRLRVSDQMAVDRTVLRAGLVTVDTALGLVSVAGRLVTLSPTEYALLVALASRPGEPVSQERLTTEVWGQRKSSNLVEVYIGYLRRKLGPDRIRTVRGAGYVLDG